VKQAETLSEILNRHRPGMANWVCGKTPKEERQDLLKRFETGNTQVVVNCGVLTEGYDNPAVEIVIMARPTKSRSLYSQMVGRGTRPLDGMMDGLETPESRRLAIDKSSKPSLLVVDFVGNSGRHKLVTSADILGGNVSEEAVEIAKEIAKKDGGVMRMVEVMAEAEDELKRRREEARQKEEARKARLVAKAKFSMTSVNPFNTLDIVPMSQRGWDNGKTLTEKQRGLLLKQGINPDSMPYGAAKQLVDELFRRWGNNLCSLKQAQILKRNGYETKDLKREDASKLIDALAKNGWRRPA
jgi:type I site-specific restriction endonuclease